MKEKLVNNLGMKILSLFLAILLWMLVVNVDDPLITRKFTDVPVDAINRDVITSAGKVYDVLEGDTVDITIKAKRTVIDSLKTTDFKAVADLSKLSITNAVPIDVTVLKHSDKIKELTLGKINTMKVNLEDRVYATLPVNVVTTGQVAGGYAIGSKVAAPNLVEISGAKSYIKKVKELRVTLSVQGAYDNVVMNLAPAFYNSDGDVLDQEKIDCNVSKISVSVNLLRTKEIGLDINTKGTVADGYGITSVDYEPKSIIVAGSKSDLNKLSNIVIDDLSVDRLTKDLEQGIEIERYLPENIILAQDSKEIMVTVKVEKYIEKEITFTKEDIIILNQRDSLDLNFSNPPSIYTLTITGLREDLKDLTKADFMPTIDLKSLKAGKHKVNIITNDVDKATVVSPIKVNIILSKKVEPEEESAPDENEEPLEEEQALQ